MSMYKTKDVIIYKKKSDLGENDSQFDYSTPISGWMEGYVESLIRNSRNGIGRYILPLIEHEVGVRTDTTRPAVGIAFKLPYSKDEYDQGELLKKKYPFGCVRTEICQMDDGRVLIDHVYYSFDDIKEQSKSFPKTFKLIEELQDKYKEVFPVEFELTIEDSSDFIDKFRNLINKVWEEVYFPVVFKQPFEIYKPGNKRTELYKKIEKLVEDKMENNPLYVSGILEYEEGVTRFSAKACLSVSFSLNIDNKKDDDYRLDVIEDVNGGITYGYTWFVSSGGVCKKEWGPMRIVKPPYSSSNNFYISEEEFLEDLSRRIDKEIEYCKNYKA